MVFLDFLLMRKTPGGIVDIYIYIYTHIIGFVSENLDESFSYGHFKRYIWDDADE